MSKCKIVDHQKLCRVILNQSDQKNRWVGVEIWNSQYFENWNNENRFIRFFNFQIYFLYLRLFKLLEHSKYMIIYGIENFWNFDSFTNCEILKICWFSKLNNFRNLIILWTCQSRKFPLEYVIKVEKLKRRNWFISKSRYEYWQNCESCGISNGRTIPKLPIFGAKLWLSKLKIFWNL